MSVEVVVPEQERKSYLRPHCPLLAIAHSQSGEAPDRVDGGLSSFRWGAVRPLSALP